MLITVPRIMSDFLNDALNRLRWPTTWRASLLIVFLGMGQIWMAYASVVSASHLPDGGHGQVSISTAQTPEHAGHTHDAPDSTDHDAGYQHGHNAWDHSHDKPNLTYSVHAVAIQPSRIFNAAHQIAAHPSPYFGFERPPKPLLLS